MKKFRVRAKMMCESFSGREYERHSEIFIVLARHEESAEKKAEKIAKKRWGLSGRHNWSQPLWVETCEVADIGLDP